VCGLAFWLHQLSLSFILVISLILVIKIIKEYSAKIFLFCLVIFLFSFSIGALPLIIYNINNDLHNIKVIFGFLFDVGGEAEYRRLGLIATIKNSLNTKMSGYGIGLVGRLREMASVTLGVNKDYNGAYLWLNSALIINWGLLTAVGIYRFFSGKFNLSDKKHIYILLAISAIVIIPGLKQDRYLLPMNFIIPVLLSIVLKALRKRTVCTLLIPLILFNSLAVIKAKDNSGHVIPETKMILRFLEKEKLDRGYAEHNLAYPILFYSQKKIMISTIAEPPFYDDLPEITGEVKNSNHNFYLYSKQNPQNQNLINYSNEQNIAYQLKQIGGYNLFFGFTQKIEPEHFIARRR